MINKQLLSVSDVAAYLKIPKSSVYQHIRDGRLPAHRVGKHYRLVQDEVEEWCTKG